MAPIATGVPESEKSALLPNSGHPLVRELVDLVIRRWRDGIARLTQV